MCPSQYGLSKGLNDPEMSNSWRSKRLSSLQKPLKILMSVRPALYSQDTTGSFHRNKAVVPETRNKISTGTEIKTFVSIRLIIAVFN
jgi:hypothetical protein